MRHRPEADPGLVERLKRLDTCAVSDALDRLGLEGALTGFQRWGPPRRMAGRVVTVRLEPGPASPGMSHLGTRAVSAAGPGDVIVVANAGRTAGGSWGGLLTLQAHLRRVSGVVVDGALRDADEVAELNVPVLARGTTPRTARGRFHEAETGGPVVVCGVRVDPGALLLADGSGVVVVAARDANRVLALAGEVMDREARMAQRLKDGHRGSDVLDGGYERMLDPEAG